MAKAEELGLDLVEISPTAQPPVCRICDYGKWKYAEEKQAKSQKKNNPELKQIRLHPRTEEHDLVFKIRNSREFIVEGHKVQFEVRFKGRENAHPETATPVLDRIVTELSDIAKVIITPKYENKSTILVMAPK